MGVSVVGVVILNLGMVIVMALVAVVALIVYAEGMCQSPQGGRRSEPRHPPLHHRATDDLGRRDRIPFGDGMVNPANGSSLISKHSRYDIDSWFRYSRVLIFLAGVFFGFLFTTTFITIPSTRRTQKIMADGYIRDNHGNLVECTEINATP